MKVRAIVLAAGKGTRMKSTTPKVLHELCGRPMLWYTLSALRSAGIDDVLVVTNDELELHMPKFGVRSIVQREQLGTGHAVKVALEALEASGDGRVIVAYGDMPLVTSEIFGSMIDSLETNGGGAVMSLVTVKMPLPSNFGRIVRSGATVQRIVEVRDASPEQLAIDEMNAGIYAFDERELRDAIAHLKNDNAQKEYYLTDTVEHFVRAGKAVHPVVAGDHLDVLGINDRVELARARKELNARICAQHMRDGVTIIDPDTTYLEPELTIGRDALIYPNSSISRLSEIGAHAVVGPNARISGSRVGDGSIVRESVIIDSEVGSDVTIGPFAHLRGGAALGDGSHVGNFVEIKKSTLAAGVKAGHLSYLGDASIGENTNIGAGTITCNYDGVRKNVTTIGKNAFIGSNSSLVAPVNIGDNALTGAGAVVIRDVPDGARVVGNPAKTLQKKESI